MKKTRFPVSLVMVLLMTRWTFHCVAEDEDIKSWRFHGDMFQRFAWIEWGDFPASEADSVLQILNGSKASKIIVNQFTPLHSSQTIQFRTDAQSDFWFEMNPGYSVSIENGTGNLEECEPFFPGDNEDSDETYQTKDIKELRRTLYCMTFAIHADHPDQENLAGILHISWNHEWTRDIRLIPRDFRMMIKSFSAYDKNSTLLYEAEYKYLSYTNRIQVQYLDKNKIKSGYDVFVYDKEKEQLVEKQIWDAQDQLLTFYVLDFHEDHTSSWLQYNSEDDPQTDDPQSDCSIWYDASDRLMERMNCFNSEENLQYYLTYHYSAKELLDTRNQYKSSDEFLGKTDYFYNDHDLLMSLFQLDKENSIQQYFIFHYQEGTFQGNEQDTIFINEKQ